VATIGDEALRVLEEFPWPGNIRQLENAIQLAVLFSEGEVLRPEHLPSSLRDGYEEAERQEPVGLLRNQRLATERSMIQQVLAQYGDSRSQAAQALGISRMTLYNKMKKYGLIERAGA
jgi:DNA-binding NtrC family response regulator